MKLQKHFDTPPVQIIHRFWPLGTRCRYARVMAESRYLATVNQCYQWDAVVFCFRSSIDHAYASTVEAQLCWRADH